MHDVGVGVGDAAADDDLIAIAALGDCTQDAWDLLQSGLIDDTGVLQFEAKPRRAVGEAGYVAGTADLVDNLFGCFCSGCHRQDSCLLMALGGISYVPATRTARWRHRGS